MSRRPAGAGRTGYYAGGGGGGRIALSFADPPAASLPISVSAPGGFNSLPPDANAQQIGGAGTVYLEELDALGAPKAPGKLIVTNASGKPAWPTPFSGAQRFGSVEGHGAARLVFTDDLTVGPDPGVVNDRASVSLDAEARLLLKADAPQIALTASPDGGNVTTGQQLSISYTLSDPIGLFARVATFSPSGAVTTVFADEPASVSSGALSLQVPASQPPGPVTYSLQVSDRAGRTQTVYEVVDGPARRAAGAQPDGRDAGPVRPAGSGARGDGQRGGRRRARLRRLHALRGRHGERLAAGDRTLLGAGVQHPAARRRSRPARP